MRKLKYPERTCSDILAAGPVISLSAAWEGLFFFFKCVYLARNQVNGILLASYFEMVPSFLKTDGGSAFYHPERLTHTGSM